MIKFIIQALVRSIVRSHIQNEIQIAKSEALSNQSQLNANSSVANPAQQTVSIRQNSSGGCLKIFSLLFGGFLIFFGLIILAGTLIKWLGDEPSKYTVTQDIIGLIFLCVFPLIFGGVLIYFGLRKKKETVHLNSSQTSQIQDQNKTVSSENYYK